MYCTLDALFILPQLCQFLAQNHIQVNLGNIQQKQLTKNTQHQFWRQSNRHFINSLSIPRPKNNKPSQNTIKIKNVPLLLKIVRNLYFAERHIKRPSEYGDATVKKLSMPPLSTFGSCLKTNCSAPPKPCEGIDQMTRSSKGAFAVAARRRVLSLPETIITYQVTCYSY